jgi:hypothetical protein
MNRHSEMVTVGGVSIETYIDGNGPAVVVLPSCGRDGGGRPIGGKPNVRFLYRSGDLAA